MRHWSLLPVAGIGTALLLAPCLADTVETFATLPASFEDVSVGPDGSVYLPSSPAGGAAFRVDLDGSIHQIASGLLFPLGGAVDSDGNFYVSCWNGSHVHRLAPDGTASIFLTGINTPTGILLSPDEETMYVNSYNLGRTIKIDLPTGDREVVASGPGLVGPDGLAMDDDGNLYIANFLIPQITRVDPEGNEEIWVTMPGSDTGYIDYRAGYLYVAGLNTNRIYRVSTADGTIETIAGTGVAGTTDGPAETALVNRPNGLALSPDGQTLWFQTQNLLRRIVFDGPVGVDDVAFPEPPSIVARPNPTDGPSRVSLTLERAATVVATVHDVQGRLVRELSAGRLPAGTHVLTWDGHAHDGREVADGVYHVRLRVEGETRTVRIVRLAD